VRAQPDEEGALLTIEGWTARPASPPRLTLVGSEPIAEGSDEPERMVISVDPELRVLKLDESIAERRGIDPVRRREPLMPTCNGRQRGRVMPR
jgi:hypothetical protein